MSAPAVGRPRVARTGSEAPRARRPFEVIEDAVGSAPRRVRAAVLVGVIAVIGAAFVLVSLHVRMAQNQLELDRVRSEVAAVERVEAQHRLEVARASAPDAIIAAAQRLGLVYGGSPRLLQADAATARPTGAPVAVVGGAGAAHP